MSNELDRVMAAFTSKPSTPTKPKKKTDKELMAEATAKLKKG